MNISEPILIKPLPFGYNLIKRPGHDPGFEIWQGTNSMRDFVHRFDTFTDAVKFLIKSGHCADYKEAIKLLNKGGADA